MFDSIAPGYDAFNHLTSLGADRHWRKAALREIVGSRVLDEACGTGDFAIAIARRLERCPAGIRNVSNVQKNCTLGAKTPLKRSQRPEKLHVGHSTEGKKGRQCHREAEPGSWSVTGVDISEGMLEVMRRKLAETGLDQNGAAARCGRVSAETGDCCALKYQDASFDTVTVAFGVRNFENREKALTEALRVLRHGGRFVMLELGIPQNRLAAWLFKIYFTRITPLIGGGLSGNRDAYRYLPASVLAFPKPDEWLDTMKKAGFANLRHRSLSLGICNLFVGEKR